MDASEVEKINELVKAYQQEALELKYENWKEQLGVAEYWGDLLQLFETYVLMTTASFIRFRNMFLEQAVDDVTLRVLIRLHAKACQTALAILDILQAGYADSANVCWRSLHEINVIARFIAKYSEEQPAIKIAERYLDHDIVFHYNHECLVRRYKDQQRFEPLSKENFRKLKKRYSDLIGPSKYGPKFKEPLGWAVPILNKKLSFEELERHTELDYWRPYYADASAEIHTAAGSLYARLGLRPGVFDVLLASPSKRGLSVPMSNTAHTLMQITATVLLTKEVTEHADRLRALKALVEEIDTKSGHAEEALG